MISCNQVFNLIRTFISLHIVTHNFNALLQWAVVRVQWNFNDFCLL